jgi:hypothetical protein
MATFARYIRTTWARCSHRQRSMRSADKLLTEEKRKLTGLARALVTWSREHGRDSGGSTSKLHTTRRSSWRSCSSGRQPWRSAGSTTPLSRARNYQVGGPRGVSEAAGLAAYASKSGGQFPSDPALHVKIPAVGRYGSIAGMMFQNGRAAPLLDVNMARVIERFVRARKSADSAPKLTTT